MISFHVKFVQTDRRMDRRMDRRTMVKQYAPDLSMRGHKKFNAAWLIWSFITGIMEDIAEKEKILVTRLFPQGI